MALGTPLGMVGATALRGGLGGCLGGSGGFLGAGMLVAGSCPFGHLPATMHPLHGKGQAGMVTCEGLRAS